MRIEGGADGETHYVENRVVFDTGASSVLTIEVRVSDGVPNA